MAAERTARRSSRWAGPARLAVGLAVALAAVLVAGRFAARPPQRATATVVVEGTRWCPVGMEETRYASARSGGGRR
jgi:hypothetical protein